MVTTRYGLSISPHVIACLRGASGIVIGIEPKIRRRKHFRYETEREIRYRMEIKSDSIDIIVYDRASRRVRIQAPLATTTRGNRYLSYPGRFTRSVTAGLATLGIPARIFHVGEFDRQGWAIFVVPPGIADDGAIPLFDPVEFVLDSAIS